MSALLDLEQPLVDLKNMAGLLGHLSETKREIDGEELAHIKTVLEECHEDLHSWWESETHKENEEHGEEIGALRAEIAALKLSHAPPGSASDVESAKTCWWLLTSAALTVISEAEAAGVKPGERAAVSEDRAADRAKW